MAAMLVDIHFNDPEQSTLLLLPFTDAFLEHLSLFVYQMRVVARSVADPAMFVRRHGSSMHPWRQFHFLCPRVGPLLNVAYWIGADSEQFDVGHSLATFGRYVQCELGTNFDY